MIENYITVKEAGEKWNLKERTIQEMCVSGRIQGAVKFGKSWAIPADAKRPKDRRIITGKFRDWRKEKKEVTRL
jgi:excisionase family DNA binding protein